MSAIAAGHIKNIRAKIKMFLNKIHLLLCSRWIYRLLVPLIITISNQIVEIFWPKISIHRVTKTFNRKQQPISFELGYVRPEE